MADKKIAFLSAVIVSVFSYIHLSYFTARADSYQVFANFIILFGCYLVFLKYKELSSVKIFISLAIFFRLILLFQIPNLSDDFYRFLFDGNLLAEGINPYTVLPSAYQGPIDKELISKINSPNYYSVYPPVLQYLFGLVAWLSKGNLIIATISLRVITILAELGTTFFLIKILRFYNLPEKNSLIYLLNPLIIVELTGNLHSEAIMISFLVVSIWFLINSKIIFSSVSFGLAVGSKLIPLIFLPMLLIKMTRKTGFLFTTILFVTLLLLFIPFIDSQLINLLKSVDLYFHTFEFNASIFYLLKNGMYFLFGIDAKGVLRNILPLIVICIIMYISLKWRKESISSAFNYMMLILFSYYLFSTTIHPWYLSTLVVFSVFTSYRFVILWSFLVTLSYFTYQNGQYKENLFLILLEYSLLLTLAVSELAKKAKVYLVVP